MCVCVCVSQRRDIVTGTVEPTDEECEWQSDREEEELAVSAAAFFFVFMDLYSKCKFSQIAYKKKGSPKLTLHKCIDMYKTQ